LAVEAQLAADLLELSDSLDLEPTGRGAPRPSQVLILDRPQGAGRSKTAQTFLTFFGSQTSLFFLTTAPQSSQRYRPGLGFAFDFPLRQLISSE
jgi:hypothetical protein